MLHINLPPPFPYPTLPSLPAYINTLPSPYPYLTLTSPYLPTWLRRPLSVFREKVFINVPNQKVFVKRLSKRHETERVQEDQDMSMCDN